MRRLHRMGLIGQRLREARQAAGLTLEQAGAVAGVTKQGISQIERGVTKNPEAATLEPLCRRLGINLQWLMNGKGPREASVTGAAFSDSETRPESQLHVIDAAILAEAIKWLTFEETASGEPAHPLRRAQRLIALYQAIQADGGTLSPEHARELIEAARPHTQEGVSKHGKGGKRNGTT